jgi:hypothetical protein
VTSSPRTSLTSTATGTAVPVTGSTATTTTTEPVFSGTATQRSIARTGSATGTATMAPLSGSDTSEALTSVSSAESRSAVSGADGGGYVEGTPVTGDSTTAIAGTKTTRAGATTAAPVVMIETPVDRATFASGATIVFAGLARDAANISLTDRIVWRSSLEGHLGTGGTITKVLKAGTHTITATVVDRDGNTSRAQVVVIVLP